MNYDSNSIQATAATEASQTAAVNYSSAEYAQYYQNYYQNLAVSNQLTPTDYTKAWEEYYKAIYGQNYSLNAVQANGQIATNYSYDQYITANSNLSNNSNIQCTSTTPVTNTQYPNYADQSTYNFAALTNNWSQPPPDYNQEIIPAQTVNFNGYTKPQNVNQPEVSNNYIATNCENMTFNTQNPINNGNINNPYNSSSGTQRRGNQGRGGISRGQTFSNRGDDVSNRGKSFPKRGNVPNIIQNVTDQGDNLSNRDNNFNTNVNISSRGQNVSNRGDYPSNRGHSYSNRGDNPTIRGQSSLNRGDIPSNIGQSFSNRGDIQSNRNQNISNIIDIPSNTGDSSLNVNDISSIKGQSFSKRGDISSSRGQNFSNRGEYVPNRLGKAIIRRGNAFNGRVIATNRGSTVFNSRDRIQPYGMDTMDNMDNNNENNRDNKGENKSTKSIVAPQLMDLDLDVYVKDFEESDLIKKKGLHVKPLMSVNKTDISYDLKINKPSQNFYNRPVNNILPSVQQSNVAIPYPPIRKAGQPITKKNDIEVQDLLSINIVLSENMLFVASRQKSIDILKEYFQSKNESDNLLSILNNSSPEEIKEILNISIYSDDNICEISANDVFLIQKKGKTELDSVELCLKSLINLFKSALFITSSNRLHNAESIPNFTVTTDKNSVPLLPPIPNGNKKYFDFNNLHETYSIEKSLCFKAFKDIVLILEDTVAGLDQDVTHLNNTAKFNDVTVEFKHEKKPEALHISRCKIIFNGEEIAVGEARDYLVAKRQVAEDVIISMKKSCSIATLRLEHAKSVARNDLKLPSENCSNNFEDYLRKTVNVTDDILFKFGPEYTKEERAALLSILPKFNLVSKSDLKSIYVFKQFTAAQVKTELIDKGICAQYQLVERAFSKD